MNTTLTLIAIMLGIDIILHLFVLIIDHPLPHRRRGGYQPDAEIDDNIIPLDPRLSK